MTTTQVFVSLLLAAASTGAPVTSNHQSPRDNPIRAVYMPVNNHEDIAEIVKAIIGGTVEADTVVEKVDTRSQLEDLIVSGKANIAFITCPSAAKLLNTANKSENNSAVSAAHKYSGPCSKSPQGKGAAVHSRMQADIDEESGADQPSSTGQAGQITPALQRVLNNRMKIIKKYAADPFIVNAVKLQNAKSMSLEMYWFSVNWTNSIYG